MNAEIARRLFGVSLLVVSFLFAKATTKKDRMPGNMATLGMVIGFVTALAQYVKECGALAEVIDLLREALFFWAEELFRI